jgi:hypothetical protein
MLQIPVSGQDAVPSKTKLADRKYEQPRFTKRKDHEHDNREIKKPIGEYRENAKPEA